MKFRLSDDTYAHLWGIVQTASYRQDYKELPTDAKQDVKRIAQMYMASSCWRRAPLILLTADEETLTNLMRRKQLPTVMCIGEFFSYRRHPDGQTKPKAIYLHLIWLQEEFLPYLSPENEALFQRIDWDRYLPSAI